MQKPIEKLDYKPPMTREERKAKERARALSYMVFAPYGRSIHRRSESVNEMRNGDR